MAGRPRTISDERLLSAVAVAVGRVGAGRLTLADVAREAGVSTGALVQRFGTKRGLLLAFVRASDPAATMRGAYARRADAGGDPVDALVAALVALAGPGRDPAEFANHLGFLHLELADEEFRGGLADFDAAMRTELAAYLETAVSAGLVRTGDPAALVDAVVGLFHGVQIAWAIRRVGTLAEALDAAVRTLLAPKR